MIYLCCFNSRMTLPISIKYEVIKRFVLCLRVQDDPNKLELQKVFIILFKLKQI